MLMITLEADAPTPTLRLDGQLTGPGVRELARHWRATAVARPHQRVMFDLAGLTSVDALGREFLANVHRLGDTLVVGGTIGALVDESRQDPPNGDWPSEEPRAVYDLHSSTVHAFVDPSS
jgi:ABC-type transporter Mla MlaB component